MLEGIESFNWVTNYLWISINYVLSTLVTIIRSEPRKLPSFSLPGEEIMETRPERYPEPDELVNSPQYVDADTDKYNEDAGYRDHCKHPVVENTNFWKSNKIQIGLFWW